MSVLIYPSFDISWIGSCHIFGMAYHSTWYVRHVLDMMVSHVVARSSNRCCSSYFDL
jgi:hypothetical protein